jgi:CDP-diacylglycerol--glycerol-3-phosphate 3-phosphatidyltransferase
VTGSIVSPATRQRVRDLAIPIATALGRLGLTPNALTVSGFLGTCVAAWAATNQAWLAAAILVLVFGMFDLFDGALARATGRATKLGAFLDSTFDRAGEAIVYIGIAAGCLAAGFQVGALIAATALATSQLVSYVRAKAESLGFSPGSGMAAVGLAPREVRLVLLALGLALAGFLGGVSDVQLSVCPGTPGQACTALLGTFGPSGGQLWLGGSLGLIAILATITTIQRILHVRAQSREG